MQPCPAGQAKARLGTYSCRPCDRNVNGKEYFTPFKASTRCKECPGGGVAFDDFAACAPG